MVKARAVKSAQGNHVIDIDGVSERLSIETALAMVIAQEVPSLSGWMLAEMNSVRVLHVSAWVEHPEDDPVLVSNEGRDAIARALVDIGPPEVSSQDMIKLREILA